MRQQAGVAEVHRWVWQKHVGGNQMGVAQNVGGDQVGVAEACGWGPDWCGTKCGWGQDGCGTKCGWGKTGVCSNQPDPKRLSLVSLSEVLENLSLLGV